MKIFEVVEEWDNCEAYEEHADSSETIRLCATLDLAKKVVQQRIDELVELAKEYEGIIEHDPNRYKEYYKGIKIEWTDDCPTDTYNFGKERYIWYIKETELMES